jgi:hypothetical protein
MNPPRILFLEEFLTQRAIGKILSTLTQSQISLFWTLRGVFNGSNSAGKTGDIPFRLGGLTSDSVASEPFSPNPSCLIQPEKTNSKIESFTSICWMRKFPGEWAKTARPSASSLSQELPAWVVVQFESFTL